MLVTDRKRTRGRRLLPLVHAAVRGGAGLVQVREKDLADDALRGLVASLRDRLPTETRIAVNGSYRVARTTGSGLHLPADQALPWSGRGAPRDLWWGRSAHGPRELDCARREGADYVIVGTVYATESKPGRRAAGPALIERARRDVGEVPIYAIGGMTVSRIPEVVHAGAHGVAVCSAILSANDPQRVAEAMLLALNVACGGAGE
jgi:thiamine-phosphate pyrophosphorylase